MRKISFVAMIVIIISVFCSTSAIVFADSGDISSVDADSGKISVSAKSALLLDADSGSVVLTKDENERLQIASMVKIMTLNIIFEEIAMGRLAFDDNVVVSEYATSMGGSQAFLDSNVIYKAEELIKSIIVASANDSCVAMAEHICGSVPAFVERMNMNAEAWGMNDTVFVNCTGLPAPTQYSTASNVAIMMKKLIGYDDFFKFSKVWTYELVHPSGRTTLLTNTNKLSRFYNGCDGGKTGYTSEAKSCLAATAKRGDTRLICVVVGADNAKVRNAEVSKLLDYGFANYETKLLIGKGSPLEGNVGVVAGRESNVGVVSENDVKVFGRRGENKNFVTDTEFFEVKAPVVKGQKCGELRFLNENGDVVGKTALVAQNDVEAIEYFDIVNDFVKKW